MPRNDVSTPTTAPASPLPWKLAGQNIYPRYKNWGYVSECKGPDVASCNGDIENGWQNAAYIVTVCNAFPAILGALTAVLHQMEHGEASDFIDADADEFAEGTQGGDENAARRDLQWCREQLRQAIKSIS